MPAVVKRPTIIPGEPIKWGFVDLYLLISAFMESFYVKDQEGLFHDFYTGFEQNRRLRISDLEVLAASKSDWDQDLFKYIESFQKAGATKKNIETRHHVYRNKAINDIPSLMPIDPKRLFSREEKTVLWRRSQGKCSACNKYAAIDDCHADHIVPHAKGGHTTIENGQILCVKCNLTKGSK